MNKQKDQLGEYEYFENTIKVGSLAVASTLHAIHANEDVSMSRRSEQILT